MHRFKSVGVRTTALGNHCWWSLSTALLSHKL